MANHEHGVDAPLGANVPVFSVSELSQALKRAVEEGFGWVRVRGEVSNLRRPGSGHVYFDLKDENALLSAVCWRSTAERLSLKPEDGLEVIASGRVTTYAAQSRYQIIVQSLELAGEGALLKLLEERRKKLAAEGLFDEARKRPLPFLPETVGVVTSPSGAVIRDILHRIADRFPRRVLLWPVLVQGEGAAEQIAAAIAGFNTLAPGGDVPRPDVLIVARGGGSLEDLWAFNEEVVVRAAAASEIPLISAVGHETDTTLIDFASDRRAPTPTAAAEMAVPVRAELAEDLLGHERRLLRAMRRVVEEKRARVEGLGRGLPDARSLLGTAAQRLDDWSERLRPRHIFSLKETKLDALARRLHQASPRADMTRHKERLVRAADALAKMWQRFVKDQAEKLATADRLLESYSYKSVLERGYAVVRDDKEKPVTAAEAVTPGQALSLEFSDGRAEAVAAGRPGGARKGGRRSGSDDKGQQGSLL